MSLGKATERQGCSRRQETPLQAAEQQAAEQHRTILAVQKGERDGEVDPNQLGAAPPGLATRPGPESEQAVGQEGHQKHAARRAAPPQAMDDLGVVEWVDHGRREDIAPV